MSNHPREERTIELTEDYRLPDGSWLLPELLAWDGMETVWDDAAGCWRRQRARETEAAETYARP